MFGSGVLDVAIGLVFVFLLVSLIVTTANEFIAALLSARAKWLRRGMERLLGSVWAAALYEHPLIEGSSLGKTGPSYIASRSFSTALLDIVVNADKTLPMATALLDALRKIPPRSDRDAFIAQLLPTLESMSTAGGTAKTIADDVVDLIGRLPADGLNAADATATVKSLLDDVGVKYIGSIIANIDDPKIQRSLKVLYDDAGGEIAKLKENVEIWFNNAMDRVGGWYKRKSQWVIALIAIVVTLVLNVDAMLIVQHLNTQSALRDTVVAEAKGFSDRRTALGGQVTSGGDSTASNTTPASAEALLASERNTGAELDKLQLPIGWYRPSQAAGRDSVAMFREENRLVLQTDGWLDIVQFHVVGWLLTTLAASLGAPFWFDTLNKFMSIRAAGKAPEERPRTPKEVPLPLEPGQSPREADRASRGRT